MNAFSQSLLLAVAGLGFAGCADIGGVSEVDGTSQGTMIANTRAGAGARTSPAMEVAGDPEGVLRRDGSLYYVKDGRTTPISGRQRVTREIYLENNGDVTMADGRRMRVPEGSMVTRGGDLIDAPAALR